MMRQEIDVKSRQTKDEVRERLRSVIYPGFSRDIVTAGFVRYIEVDGSNVTIKFVPRTANHEKIAAMEAGIRAALEDEFETVVIQTTQPLAGDVVLSESGMTPLQAEIAADGITPEPDGLQGSLRRPDLAPDAGYDEDGPEPMGGPTADTYEGPLPVFQWEIDPQDETANSGTTNLRLDGWDFRIWWQAHPSRLVYASLQAMRDDTIDHGGAARAHPVGRTDAVNLVFDRNRGAVVAIYGTVSDFRPFVEAFHQGYVLKTNGSPATEEG